MSVTQYVGARYVPIVVGEWDNTKTYEPLMVVTYQGNSYTSRQYVPTGIEITNESYWILSANYNAQVDAYRNEVTQFDGRIDANATANTEHTNQLAGTADSGLKTLITNESTARGTKDTALDAQLAGTTDSGLKTLIDANTNQLAGTADSGLKSMIDENTNKLAGTADSGLNYLLNNAQLGNPNYTLIGDYRHNNTNTLSTQCITPNITNDGFAIFGHVNNDSSGFAYNAKLDNTIQYYAISNEGHYNDAATYNNKYYVISDFNNVLVLNADFVVENTISLPTTAYSITRGFNNVGWILWTNVNTTSSTYTITDDNFNIIESHTIPCGGFNNVNPSQSLCVINDYLYLVYAKNIVKVDKNNNIVTVFTTKYLGGLELEGICYLNNITYAVFNIYKNGSGFCIAATSISQHATLPEALQFAIQENTGIYYNEKSFNTWLTGLITNRIYPFRNLETLAEVYKYNTITTTHLLSDITNTTILPKNNLYIVGEAANLSINGLTHGVVNLENVSVYGDIQNSIIYAGNCVTFGNTTDNTHIWNTEIFISTTTVNIDLTNANIDSTYIIPNSLNRDIKLISNVNYNSGDTITSPISNMVALYNIMAQNRNRLRVYLSNGTGYQCVPLYLSSYHTSTFFGSSNLFNSSASIWCNVVFSENRSAITYTCSDTSYKLTNIVIG